MEIIKKSRKIKLFEENGNRKSFLKYDVVDNHTTLCKIKKTLVKYQSKELPYSRTFGFITLTEIEKQKFSNKDFLINVNKSAVYHKFVHIS